MNETTKRAMRENFYQPANRVMNAICNKPYTTMAALTTFGIGIALLVPAGRRRLASSTAMTSAGPYREMSAPESSYFEAAPRSIYGSHRSYEEYAEPGSGMVKRSGSYLFGSAVLLTTLYLLGRNGRVQLSRKEP